MSAPVVQTSTESYQGVRVSGRFETTFIDEFGLTPDLVELLFDTKQPLVIRLQFVGQPHLTYTLSRADLNAALHHGITTPTLWAKPDSWDPTRIVIWLQATAGIVEFSLD